MDRDFDIVVFGATGFVGKLIARELVRSAPGGTRVALAGRDGDKVRRVAGEIEHPELDVIVADAFDRASLDAMAARARVVISTVGPYVKYGREVVAACAAAGTHYCDLVGEVLFVRDTADELDAQARETGATIVNSCGFDSVPSDIGVLVAADAAREAGAGELTRTVMHVKDFAGGLSGGTFDALRAQIDAGRTAVRVPGRSSSDPYALSPDRDAEPEPRRKNDQIWLETSADTREFAAPFFMARFNEQLVRRSNALLGWRYGRDFRYREVQDTGAGALGLVKGVAVAAALPLFVASLVTPGARQIADRLLPKPGEGPSDAARARGHFRVEIYATTTSGKRVEAVVADHRDPGYDSTAVMIAQAALALAAGEALCAGVVTPAVGLGERYAARLREQGFVVEAKVA